MPENCPCCGAEPTLLGIDNAGKSDQWTCGTYLTLFLSPGAIVQGIRCKELQIATLTAERDAALQREVEELKAKLTLAEAKIEYHDASALVGRMYYGFFGDNGVTSEQVDAAKERQRIAAETLFALSPKYFEDDAAALAPKDTTDE